MSSWFSIKLNNKFVFPDPEAPILIFHKVSNINNVCVSWYFQNIKVYRPDLHNLQTRREKFTSS